MKIPRQQRVEQLMEETKHWESLKAGDIKALQGLYEQHINSLYSYGMALCQDTDKVKDCIHDLFLSFWHNRDGLNIPSSGKAYLMVSLRRRIFDKGPKSNLMVSPLENEQMNDGFTSDPEVKWIIAEEEAGRQQKLDYALTQLSDRQREIIYMKYFQQMEYDEIARIMNLNYQSARNLVTRSLTALRKEMTIIFILLILMI